MARYEYQCEACAEHIEITRSIEDSLSRVPYCDGCLIPMKRVYTSPSVQFKGDGWGSS
jgi:putative FmdB family regulatory protein